MDLHALLSDPRLYERQIERLREKSLHRPRSVALEQDGVALPTVFLHRQKVARLLAAAMGAGEYEFQPARTRWTKVGKKQRLLYVFGLNDLIVHGVMADILSEASRPHLPVSLHSYIKGRSWASAVLTFADYVREHRRNRPDVRTRGIYVLRRDIRDYANSIPVDDFSKLFPSLQQVLSIRPGQSAQDARHWAQVKMVVRPEFHPDAERPEGAGGNRRGIPTGSPISTPLMNLYLTAMDRQLEAVPGGFWARYCDDFLFAHPDPGVVGQVDHMIDSLLASFRLGTNKSKNLDFYFNGAGRSSSDWPSARGTPTIDFLGCSVTFEGSIALQAAKARRLLRDMHSRARRTLKAWPKTESSNDEGADAAFEEQGRAICTAINCALNPSLPLCQKSAIFLLRQVTDRRQLRQLDYRLARVVARVMTGEAGVKSFQRVPYRKIRADWKLVSLCHARRRNRAGSKSRI